MKRNIDLWSLIGFGVVSLLGTLLHFLYDIFPSPLTALFSGVNESTWEHMKLLFFPMLLFAVVQSFFFREEYENFWCIKLRGTLLGLVLIPVLFYTLRGVFGETPDLVNITIFFLSAGAAYLYEAGQFKKGSVSCPRLWAIGTLALIAVAFFLFTFNPPAIPLFQDPVSGEYGIAA